MLKKAAINSIYLLSDIFYKKNVRHLAPLTVLKALLIQKIIGINRRVTWPVHWSSSIKSHEKINPGSRSPGFSANCHIDGRNGIEFGENVWVGPSVKIISMNHDVNNYEKYTKGLPIRIGRDSWLASNCVILPEVEIGAHTVVAAGAVVTKSFPNCNQVLAGVPAKVIKNIEDYEHQ